MAVAVSGTLVVALMLLPALAGTASAAPAPAVANTSTQWAYGGQGWSSGNVAVSGVQASWNATIGLAVVFTANATAPNVTELKEQRTLMVDLTLSVSEGAISGSFSLKALEADLAFANLTNASTVYVAGSPVAALGILNASLEARASLAESLAFSDAGFSASEDLNAAGNAHAGVWFAPSLGLVPRNLSGISAWNSSAQARTGGAWNISYNWAVQDSNGTSASKAGSDQGNWDLSGLVNLTGQTFAVGVPHFHDHNYRTGVALSLQGPADLYDGFIFVPHAFDFFGGAPHTYDNVSVGNATISGESVYVTNGTVGAGSFSAAQATYGGNYTAPAAIVRAPGAATPVAANPGATVIAQPESPQQAQSQAYCFENGCVTSPPWFSGLVEIAIVVGVLGAIAGTAGALLLRRSGRRQSLQQPQVGSDTPQTSSIAPGAAAPTPTTALGSPPTGPDGSNGGL